MSLKNLFDGAVSAAAGLAPNAPSPPAELRDAVIRQIDELEARWSTREAGIGGGWYHQDGEHVAFTPVLPNGAPLTIDGQTTTFVPADRFADFLINMRNQVTAGAFDAQIKAGLHGTANVSGLAQVAMPKRREGSSEDIRQDQSAELSERQQDGSAEGR